MAQLASQARSLNADTILELLANRRRRYLLYALEGRSDPIELARIADQVASWEFDRPPADITQQEHKSVYVSSVQCHVPKLAETGIVEHEESTHAVVLDENFDVLEPYLELIALDEPPDTLVAQAIRGTEEGLIGQLRQNVRKLTS